MSFLRNGFGFSIFCLGLIWSFSLKGLAVEPWVRPNPDFTAPDGPIYDLKTDPSQTNPRRSWTSAWLLNHHAKAGRGLARKAASVADPVIHGSTTILFLSVVTIGHVFLDEVIKAHAKREPMDTERLGFILKLSVNALIDNPGVYMSIIGDKTVLTAMGPALEEFVALTKNSITRPILAKLLTSGVISFIAFCGWELGHQLWVEAQYMLPSPEDFRRSQSLFGMGSGLVQTVLAKSSGGSLDPEATENARVFGLMLGNMAQILFSFDDHLMGKLLYNTWRLRIAKGDFVALVSWMAAAGVAGSYIVPSWGSLAAIGGAAGHAVTPTALTEEFDIFFQKMVRQLPNWLLRSANSWNLAIASSDWGEFWDSMAIVYDKTIQEPGFYLEEFQDTSNYYACQLFSIPGPKKIYCDNIMVELKHRLAVPREERFAQYQRQMGGFHFAKLLDYNSEKRSNEVTILMEIINQSQNRIFEAVHYNQIAKQTLVTLRDPNADRKDDMPTPGVLQPKGFYVEQLSNPVHAFRDPSSTYPSISIPMPGLAALSDVTYRQLYIFSLQYQSSSNTHVEIPRNQTWLNTALSELKTYYTHERQMLEGLASSFGASPENKVLLDDEIRNVKILESIVLDICSGWLGDMSRFKGDLEYLLQSTDQLRSEKRKQAVQDVETLTMVGVDEKKLVQSYLDLIKASLPSSQTPLFLPMPEYDQVFDKIENLSQPSLFQIMD